MDWVARKRDWRQFVRFKAWLGRQPGSAYYARLMLDPAVAEAMEKLPKATNPPLRGFTPLLARLTDIGDILLKAAAANGGGDPNKARLPRPLTAADTLALSRRQVSLNHVVAKATPQYVHLTPQLKAV